MDTALGHLCQTGLGAHGTSSGPGRSHESEASTWIFGPTPLEEHLQRMKPKMSRAAGLLLLAAVFPWA